MVILKRIKLVRSIEILVIFAVATFNLAVVTRCKDSNELVADNQIIKRLLKERWPFFLGAAHPSREFCAVIRLDALDGIRELLHAMPNELGRRVRIVSLKASR